MLLNYRLAAREVALVLEDSGASALVFHEDIAETVLSLASYRKVNPISIGKKRLTWAKTYESCVDEGVE